MRVFHGDAVPRVEEDAGHQVEGLLGSVDKEDLIGFATDAAGAHQAAADFAAQGFVTAGGSVVEGERRWRERRRRQMAAGRSSELAR